MKLLPVMEMILKKKQSYKVKFQTIRFLQTLIYHFNSDALKKWLKFIPTLITLFRIKKLRTILFNCITTFIEILKAKLIPILNFLVKTILNQSFKIIKDPSSGSSLICAMIACLTSLIKHLWKFLTRYFLKIIKISTHSNLIKFSIRETELEYLNRDLVRNLSKVSTHQFLSIIIKFYKHSSYNTSIYSVFQLLGLTILNLK